MKAIRKLHGSGQALVRHGAESPKTGVDATAAWGSFGYKARLLAELLDEQFGLCCYSEINADKCGFGYHIEHVRNKRQYPGQTFDYQNLAASALASDDLSRLGAETFGGHAKGKQAGVDVARFVSCHQADCGRFFAYLSDGRVAPAQALDEADTEKARHTIEQLNLNSPFLIPRRQAWWDELATYFDQHLTDDWSLPHLAMVDLVPSGRQLHSFFTLTRQFYGPLAEKVLAEHARELV